MGLSYERTSTEKISLLFNCILGEKLFDINGGSPLLHKALNQIINVLQAGAILKSQMISPQVLHAKQLQNQSSVFKCF